MEEARKLYDCPNGDHWHLIRELSGAMFVCHEAESASGSQVEHVGLRDFLSRGSVPSCRNSCG
jgi:hypothetical protein